MELAALAFLAILVAARGLVGRGLEIHVAATTPATGAEDEFIARLDQVGHRLEHGGIFRHAGEIVGRTAAFTVFVRRDGNDLVGNAADHGAGRNGDDAVGARLSRHLLLAAVLPVLGELVRRVPVTDQVVDVGIDDDDDAAAATAVAAVGTAVGHVFFAQETAGARPAVAGSRDNADAVDEHKLIGWRVGLRPDPDSGSGRRLTLQN